MRTIPEKRLITSPQRPTTKKDAFPQFSPGGALIDTSSYLLLHLSGHDVLIWPSWSSSIHHHSVSGKQRLQRSAGLSKQVLWKLIVAPNHGGLVLPRCEPGERPDKTRELRTSCRKTVRKTSEVLCLVLTRSQLFVAQTSVN